MKKLRQKLSELNLNEAENRLIKQIMDLVIIKKEGIEKGELTQGIIDIIDRLMRNFLWLYDKGLTLEANPKVFLDEYERIRYELVRTDFGVFNEFMRSHMHLVIPENENPTNESTVSIILANDEA